MAAGRRAFDRVRAPRTQENQDNDGVRRTASPRGSADDASTE
ncbi:MULTISPECIES: hypothetical protein [unclassified Streptomyces]